MAFNLNLGGGGIGTGIGAGRVAAGGCGSIFGIIWGILLIPLSFGLVYYGEARLVNHGVVFAKTAMVSIDQAAASAGGALMKFKGTPQGEFIEAERYDEPVIYWHKALEQYESERDSDGNVEYSWETKESASQWASFSIGDIKVVGDKANPVGEKTVFEGVRRGSGDFDPDRTSQTPQVGDQKLTIKVIDSGVELILLGDVSGKSLSGGTSFVISALNEAETEQALRLEYKIMYWVLKGGAVMAMWVGILALFGPLMSIVGWIPFLGERISGALAFGALFISLGVVAVATAAIKFFWIIVALVVLVIVFLVWRGIATPRQRPGAALPPPPIPPPAAPPAPPVTPPAAPPPPPPPSVS